MNTDNANEIGYQPRGFVVCQTSKGGLLLMQFEGEAEMKSCSSYLTTSRIKITTLEDFNFTIKEVFKPGDVFQTNSPPVPDFYCPHHGTKLKKSRKPNTLYCPHKLPTGSYCGYEHTYT